VTVNYNLASEMDTPERITNMISLSQILLTEFVGGPECVPYFKSNSDKIDV
jgi:hypothetical protein